VELPGAVSDSIEDRDSGASLSSADSPLRVGSLLLLLVVVVPMLVLHHEMGAGHVCEGGP
jgi:hypothetical protein